MIDPQIKEQLGKYRQSIDNIDSAIISLLAERFKCTSQVGVLKARAGFAPEDHQREDHQMKRLARIAIDAGLDPQIAQMYREFVVTEAKKRAVLEVIAEHGGLDAAGAQEYLARLRRERRYLRDVY